MQRKLLFFINPVSGARSKLSLEKKIMDICLQKGAAFEILFTSIDGDYNFLPEKIASECVTDVVICGGDGSLAPVISFLLTLDVNVGIIPLGSGNGLARTAGIPYNIDKALEVVFSGEPRRVDAFLVNDRLGCQITGLGFDAFVAAEFALQRKRGLSTYTKLAVKHFFGARPYSFEVKMPDFSLCFEAFIVCVSNANQFGNNLKIAPRASLYDGQLDVVILKKTSKAGILFSFVRHIITGRKTKVPLGDQRNILYMNATSLTILNPDGAPVHVDGDPLDAPHQLTVKVLPSAYKLIHPR